MIVTYCASQIVQFVSHCGRGGNVCIPVHVRMGLRQLVHLLADEGCVCVGGGGRGVGGNHVYHMSQVLSFCQVAVVVMTVFIWRLGGLCQPVHLPADEGGGAGCRCSSALCWLSVGWSRCHRAAYVHHERRHYLCGEV